MRQATGQALEKGQATGQALEKGQATGQALDKGQAIGQAQYTLLYLLRGSVGIQQIPLQCTGRWNHTFGRVAKLTPRIYYVGSGDEWITFNRSWGAFSDRRKVWVFQLCADLIP
ncbi:hypothetical protein GJ744_001048 [Endocarpon pusillum]|uniref:Uncharacterized protein n=1 Tax=Endocarpon pusillum TaxID=364733 RepID=A0A8H7E1I8_9EURO|nr:hypothetical protein GJ744_001048 [Endocarpon pusillum]